MASTNGLSYGQHTQSSPSWTRPAPSQHLVSQTRPIDHGVQFGPPSNESAPSPLLPIQANTALSYTSDDRASTRSHAWTSSSQHSGKTSGSATPSVKTSQSSTAQPAKKKTSSVLGLGIFTFKDPSIAAMEELAQNHKKQSNSKGGRNLPLGMPVTSSQKLPDSVPRVNSKWDGLPHQAVVKNKESPIRRDSGFSSRIPFRLQTHSVATSTNKSSAYSEPTDSPLASSNVLPDDDDNKRREFPWPPPWATKNYSTTTPSSSANTATTSSPSTYGSPLEQRKPRFIPQNRPFDSNLPLIPTVSALVDELLPPLPEHVVSPQSILSLRAPPASLMDRRAPSPLTDDTIGPGTRPALHRPVLESPRQNERSRKQALEQASRAKVEAYLHNHVSHDESGRPYNPEVPASRTPQRTVVLPSKPSSSDHTMDNAPASAPHSMTSHPVSHARNKSLDVASRASEDRPRSFVAQSPNARIRYSLPPAEAAVRHRQAAVPIYTEARRTESPQPRTSDESKRSGGTSSTVNGRNFSRPGNFSRPLHSRRTSVELPSAPATPPPHAVDTPKLSSKYASATTLSSQNELMPPFMPLDTTAGTPTSISHKDREPSREVRRPEMSPRTQSNRVETAETYAMSTAFWETATQGSKSTTPTKHASAEEEIIPFDCRLDGPFNPGLEFF